MVDGHVRRPPVQPRRTWSASCGTNRVNADEGVVGSASPRVGTDPQYCGECKSSELRYQLSHGSRGRLAGKFKHAPDQFLVFSRERSNVRVRPIDPERPAVDPHAGFDVEQIKNDGDVAVLAATTLAAWTCTSRLPGSNSLRQTILGAAKIDLDVGVDVADGGRLNLLIGRLPVCVLR